MSQCLNHVCEQNSAFESTAQVHEVPNKVSLHMQSKMMAEQDLEVISCLSSTEGKDPQETLV